MHYPESQHEIEDERLITQKINDTHRPFINTRDVKEPEDVETVDQIFDRKQLLIINDLANDNSIAKEEQYQASTIKRSLTVRQFSRTKTYKTTAPSPQSEIGFIIEPDGKLRMLWDVFTMLVIFVAILILPLDISFTIDTDFFTIFNYFSIAVFSFDILVNFFTAYQHKGQLVRDQKKIIFNYLKAWFWIDLLSTFPFDLIIEVATRSQLDEETIEQAESTQAQQNREQLIATMRLLRVLKIFRFIKVVRLLRVLKLKQIFSKLEDYVDISDALVSLYQIAKLTCIMLFIAHWLACIWHFIADQESESYSWIKKQELENEPWHVKYIASVYWATATMTTVGYGDIVPVTSNEKIFGIIVMLLACCIFAYIMNSIGSIFVTMDQNEKNMRQKMGQANQFLRSNDVPKDLQARVRKYLEYKYDTESTQIDEKKALEILSSSLRFEVLVAVNLQLIDKAPVFRSNKFERDMLQQLPFLLEEQIFGPEECIFLEHKSDELNLHQDINDERCLYFLNQGEVVLCIQSTFTLLTTLKKGAAFGELAFFTSLPRSASAYTIDFVYVQKLRKKDYLQMIKMRPHLYELFVMNEHQVSLNGNYSCLGLACLSCGEVNHFVKSCPQTHFTLNLDQRLELFKKNREKDQLLMRQYKRHKRVHYNARRYLALTREVADEINYVYKAEEIENQNLNQLQDRVEEEPSEQGMMIVGSIQIDYLSQLELDKVRAMENFFPEFNVSVVLQEFQKTQVLKKETIVQRQEEMRLRRLSKRSVRRSQSAERAEFFERLMQKYGGPEAILQLASKEEDP